MLKSHHGMNLDPSYCIGIAIDSCSIMTPQLMEALKTINYLCVFAEWTPCLNRFLISDKSTAMVESLLFLIIHGELIIILVSFKDIFSQTLPLSRYFKKKHWCIQGFWVLSDILFVLEDKWQNGETGFHELFEQATEIVKFVNSEGT